MLENILDFSAQLDLQDKAFPTFEVLDKEGKITDVEFFEQQGLTDKTLTELLKRMLKQRVLNERSVKLAKQGRLGFVAPTEGQEASQSATDFAFDKEDWILPGYRDIPQLVHKGLPIHKAFLWSRGHELGNDYGDLKGWFPQIIIGAQYIEAAGIAMGLKKRGKQQVVYTYTGDGGSSQGDFYEGINFAGAYKLPVVFIIQNNGFAISTPGEQQTAAQHLAAKGWAAGLPSIVVDGMDALGCYIAAKAAREWALAGNGPVLIETLTDRFGPHSMSGDDPLRYRSQEDIDAWKRLDPLHRYEEWLISEGKWSNAESESYRAEVNALIDEEVRLADQAPKQKVSDFLKHTFETPTYTIQEEIERYESEGK